MGRQCDDETSLGGSLVYADLSLPGFGRRRWGRGFSYLGRTGRRLKRPSLLKYCRSLVIPPAWAEVWISPNQAAHILSTGVDQRGRKQYLYHPQWTDMRNQMKFNDLREFGQALPLIRERVEADIRIRQLSRRRVLASAVSLLDQGLVRVGNEQYARTNGTFGATTLQEKHVSTSGSLVNLDFRGKSGKQRSIELTNSALARCIRHCQELPGQRLFQYKDASGIHPVDSADVNSYMKLVSGDDFTAKHFRTWGGSVAALEFAQQHTELAGSELRVAVVKCAAKTLGNTPAVAQRYYIHPGLLDAIESGDMPRKSSRSRRGLTKVESTLARFLDQAVTR